MSDVAIAAVMDGVVMTESYAEVGLSLTEKTKQKPAKSLL